MINQDALLHTSVFPYFEQSFVKDLDTFKMQAKTLLLNLEKPSKRLSFEEKKEQRVTLVFYLMLIYFQKHGGFFLKDKDFFKVQNIKQMIEALEKMLKERAHPYNEIVEYISLETYFKVFLDDVFFKSYFGDVSEFFENEFLKTRIFGDIGGRMIVPVGELDFKKHWKVSTPYALGQKLIDDGNLLPKS